MVRRTLYWLGTIMAAGAVAFMAWTHWNLAAGLAALVIGLGLRMEFGSPSPRIENLAQVAQHLHQHLGLSVERSWEAMGEAKDAVESDDPTEVLEEAIRRHDAEALTDDE